MQKFSWILLTISLWPSAVFAESQEEFAEKYYRYYSKSLLGWKGIVFVCSYDAKDKTLDAICQRAITDIELLAAANKVTLKAARGNDFDTAAFFAVNNGYIKLSYNLMATPTADGYSKAVHARLVFETYYGDAVEKKSKPGDLEGMPRSGNLEIWSKSIIGIGDPSDIVTPISDGAEIYMKNALTLFLKYVK